MKSKGCQNVYFIHRCVSDQYFTQEVPAKDIDVIQIGRKNPVMHQFMLDYCKEHPDVEYIFQSEDASLNYNSTTRGNIGKICPNIKDYDEFKTTIDQYLAGKELDKDIYSIFINKHLASARAKYLKKCIE